MVIRLPPFVRVGVVFWYKLFVMKHPLTIVKVGGAVVEGDAQLARLLDGFAAIEGRKVLVHGGGRRATAIASRLGIESRMVGGRRVTDRSMLEVVTMVYGGLVNKNIVALLQARGVDALGLTGADIDAIRSHKRPVTSRTLTTAMWATWSAWRPTSSQRS